jgi:hypothetical protein
MLRGGSLFYALAITVIMGLVSAALLLSAHYTRLQLQRDEIREEISRNSMSGLQILLNGPFYNKDSYTGDIDLFGDGTDSVFLQLKSWGAFEIAISRAHNKSFVHQRIAAAGWKSDEADRTALILADLDRPLSITGETKLSGDCYLPKAGIQRAYIEGQNYSGDKMVYGNIKTSDRFLPAYNDSLAKRIMLLFAFRPGANDSIIPLEEFEQTDSISNSFLNKTLYVFSERNIPVTQKIIGQVCIISATSIRVSKNSEIHHALLIAPRIEIEEESEGDFQAFARDSLIVEKKARLHYPTVLGIVATKRSPDVAALLLGEKVKLYGQLFACTIETDFRKHVLIATAKESLVYGEIYSSDLVDHKGMVFGAVTCAKFELKTASAEYENHLMNAVIDRPKRSADYVSSALTRKRSDRKNIVQWLH